MIRIVKSQNIPTILTTNGYADKNRLCVQYDTNPPVYHNAYHVINNPFKLVINTAIYGDGTVKNQLIADQHEKCCFCESKFLTNGYGDVEHYRPKGGYKQLAIDSLGRPGYYWLAYEWDNLLFSCDVCNRSYKKNFFPLASTNRAINHHYRLENVADCLLINPNLEDPQLHITFNKEIPAAITLKGKESINKYGIDRIKLNDERRRHLHEVKSNLMLSQINLQSITQAEKNSIMTLIGATTDQQLQDVIDIAIDYKNNCAKNNYPFTNMIRSNFPHLPQI